ncbi:MAG TPA: cupin domain-containing protein [Candidatus Binatia bacterium]
MSQHKHVVRLQDVPVDRINAPEGSSFGGLRQRVGAYLGAEKLGYSFYRIPPGKAAFPYHTHSRNEELIYIIAGEGVLRFGAEEIPVTSETVIACPTGSEYAHQLINTGGKDLRYLVVSTMSYPDLCEYPDSNKLGAYETAAVGQKVGIRALYLKDKTLNYYDGEDGKEIARITKASPKG